MENAIYSFMLGLFFVAPLLMAVGYWVKSARIWRLEHVCKATVILAFVGSFFTFTIGLTSLPLKVVLIIACVLSALMVPIYFLLRRKMRCITPLQIIKLFVTYVLAYLAAFSIHSFVPILNAIDYIVPELNVLAVGTVFGVLAITVGLIIYDNFLSGWSEHDRRYHLKVEVTFDKGGHFEHYMNTHYISKHSYSDFIVRAVMNEISRLEREEARAKEEQEQTIQKEG